MADRFFSGHRPTCQGTAGFPSLRTVWDRPASLPDLAIPVVVVRRLLAIDVDVRADVPNRGAGLARDVVAVEVELGEVLEGIGVLRDRVGAGIAHHSER